MNIDAISGLFFGAVAGTIITLAVMIFLKKDETDEWIERRRREDNIIRKIYEHIDYELYRSRERLLDELKRKDNGE